MLFPSIVGELNLVPEGDAAHGYQRSMGTSEPFSINL
jgi:hypothetical protein